MNEIVSEHTDKEIHAIMDNLKTHKPKTDRWISATPMFICTVCHSWLVVKSNRNLVQSVN